MNWISIDDELPNNNEFILVYMPGHAIKYDYISYISDYTKHSWYDEYYDRYTDIRVFVKDLDIVYCVNKREITHWCRVTPPENK